MEEKVMVYKKISISKINSEVIMMNKPRKNDNVFHSKNWGLRIYGFRGLFTYHLNHLLPIFILLFTLHTSLFTDLYAAGPGKIKYQGRLRTSGQPVSGVKSMTFEIHDHTTDDSQKWTSGAESVTVSTGIFSYELDLSASGIDWSAGNYWLEITV